MSKRGRPPKLKNGIDGTLNEENQFEIKQEPESKILNNKNITPIKKPKFGRESEAIKGQPIHERKELIYDPKNGQVQIKGKIF